MSTTRLSIRALVGVLCALSLALWMVAPATAQARPDHAGEGKAGEGKPEHAGQQGQPDHAQGNGNSDAASESKADQGSNNESKGKASGQSEGKKPQETPPPHSQGGDNGQAAQQQQVQQENNNQGDPNRGSVKIRDEGYDGSPRNEPHVWCDFTIVFLGFDEDPGRDFWIHLHPPTGEPGEALAYSGTVTLDQARGNNLSAEYPPDATDPAIQRARITMDDLTGLTEENRHPQQGWHLKLTVDGPKHKVFWIDCDEVEAVDEEDDVVADEEDDDIVADEEDDDIVADEEDEAVLADDDEADVAPVAVEEDEEGVAVLAELPVTGTHLVWLVLSALALVGAGATILRLNRRTVGIDS
jgi:hypothetical protein